MRPMRSTGPSALAILSILLTTGSAPGQHVGDDGGAGRIAYEIHGDGEPILFIHGSFMEDALRPIIDEAALQDYRRIHYDRAGYGESSPRDATFGFEPGAADALDLIQRLDLGSAHVVGYSLGGVIALQLARSNPEVVESLVLIEPPLPLAGLAEGPPPQFLIDAVELWQAGDHEAATDLFFRTIASPTWRADIAHGLPQGLEQVSRNAHLFFEEELPAFEGYLVGETDVADLEMPILYIVSGSGSEYGKAHHDRLELVRTWLAQTEPLVVPEADHALPMQRPKIIADAMKSFMQRNAR